MNQAEFLDRLENLKTWRRGDERAPHKPLLVLLALSRLHRGASRLFSFREVDQQLGQLLREFGPPRKSVHPEYPFWRLQTDEIWEVPPGYDLESRRGNTDPKKSELLEKNVEAGFTKDVYHLLQGDEGLRRRAASDLLQAHFPDSIHEELLAAVGLPSEWVGRRSKRRAGFRDEVLEAYGWRCAVCRFDGHLAGKAFGLDAAHIRWHQANGPDEVTNALALCALHHRALDRGVIGITDDRRVLVSAKLAGAVGVERGFFDFQGQDLLQPHATGLAPLEEHLQWHRKQVFIGPPRGTGSEQS